MKPTTQRSHTPFQLPMFAVASLCILLAAIRAPAVQQRQTRAGADWWSLQPIRAAAPPVVRLNGQTPEQLNPIDAFLLAKLREKGLTMAPEADRITLIRRATFDLTGLPPTPAEVDALLADRSPTAYEKVVDRLLASPHYGERWGRHWLDVARFAESQGFERDIIRDHAWRYRDYVIKALNDDKPYDQFVKEQIAGDVLPSATQERITATGFLVAGPWDEVGNTVSPSVVLRMRTREDELEDMVSAVCQTFLGMTVNCARCHDHKFDPIPQADYYRIRSALSGVRHGTRPVLPPAELAARKQRANALRNQIAAVERQAALLDTTARTRVLAARGAAAPPIAPVVRWAFQHGANDEGGGLAYALVGGAKVEGGRLKLAGNGSYLRSAPLARTIREKTLEAWVTLADLNQRGGGIISLESGEGKQFDAIVFGEREPGKWISGSESFQRTRDVAAPVEAAKPGEPVHVSAVYRADGWIELYRNGALYGAYRPEGPQASLRTFPAGESHLLLGFRHSGAGNGQFAGEILDARLYDRALTPEEVAASFRAGIYAVTPEELAAARTAEERDRLVGLEAEGTKLKKRLAAEEDIPLSYAANPEQPSVTHVLARGDVEQPKEAVCAAGLSAVHEPLSDLGLAPDAPEAERRLKLAEWIASPKNPLTARVIVNRVWHYHFGRGIVASPNDFGFNGDPPTHPELLDWLATEFVRGNWSLKKLHRLIMLSRAYRQSSRSDAAAAKVDADARLLWRFPPRRLEGEAVRDAMLAVSGQLNPTMGGPSFRPFTVFVNNSHFYTLTDPSTPEFNRRTVYGMNVNSARSPLLETLDCPDPSTKTPKRSTTTTPLQALALMNNSFVQRQAGCFAARLRKEAGSAPSAEVAAAYRLAFSRAPTASENARAAGHLARYGLESLCWALLNSSEFEYVR